MNNEMRGARYWEEEEKRVCRLCGGGEEVWEHVLGECMGGEEKGNWWDRMGEVLGGEGTGEWWMRELEKRRRRGGELDESEELGERRENGE